MTVKKFRWKRIVIKVGSALIAPDKQGCKTRHLLSIADYIMQCRAQGIQVVLVSSGSVAAGSNAFTNTENPSLTLKKAMAAKGQMDMMATWDRLLDFHVAQLLLTQGDLQIRERYKSIRSTAFELLNNDIVPIVNENDAVGADDTKIGDNDNLAAMVAAAVDADCLMICSDVDGLFNSNPHTTPDAKLLTEVDTIDNKIYAMASGPETAVGTGGMRTKLEAAEKATSNGILTFIFNGLDAANFTTLLAGDNPGTVFLPSKEPLQDDVHWLTHTSRAKGEVIVSDQIERRAEKSELPLEYNDIVNVVGQFSSGDTVLVRTEKGKKIAKATVQQSSCMLNLIAKEDHRQSLLHDDDVEAPILSENTLAILENQ